MTGLLNRYHSFVLLLVFYITLLRIINNRYISYRADKEGGGKHTLPSDLCINRSCPVDHPTYYIDQGSVCYLTNTKMGTDNMQDCLALIVQNQDTGKTALAHVSAFRGGSCR